MECLPAAVLEMGGRLWLGMFPKSACTTNSSFTCHRPSVLTSGSISHGFLSQETENQMQFTSCGVRLSRSIMGHTLNERPVMLRKAAIDFSLPRTPGASSSLPHFNGHLAELRKNLPTTA